HDVIAGAALRTRDKKPVTAAGSYSPVAAAI
ncbi:MAG: hypothetical protein ACJAQ3_001486, partial [Planctomycetota bacterium]